MEFAMIYRLDLEGSPPPDFDLYLQESLHRGFQNKASGEVNE